MKCILLGRKERTRNYTVGNSSSHIAPLWNFNNCVARILKTIARTKQPAKTGNNRRAIFEIGVWIWNYLKFRIRCVIAATCWRFPIVLFFNLKLERHDNIRLIIQLASNSLIRVMVMLEIIYSKDFFFYFDNIFI